MNITDHDLLDPARLLELLSQEKVQSFQLIASDWIPQVWSWTTLFIGILTISISLKIKLHRKVYKYLLESETPATRPRKRRRTFLLPEESQEISKHQLIKIRKERGSFSSN